MRNFGVGISVAILVVVAAAIIGLWPITRACPSDPNVVWTNCRGTRTWADGPKYTGEWKNNEKSGQGTFTSPYGTEYIGEFEGDQLSRGTVTYVNGDKYTLEKGGDYVKSLPAGISIKIEGGTFIVPVTLNDKLTLNFTIDTGASDVAVPADVVSTLVRTGSITQADFLGQTQYQMADGSIVPSQTFIIRSLKVGGKVVENVRASVASAKGGLLLGQSFLSRFGSWSVDNKNHLLFLN